MHAEITTEFLADIPAVRTEELTAFEAWLNGSVGLAKGKFTTDERLHETRGED